MINRKKVAERNSQQSCVRQILNRGSNQEENGLSEIKRENSLFDK